MHHGRQSKDRMQIIFRWTRLFGVVAVLLGVVMSEIHAASAEPILVEVWSGGDDGLTSRLRDALENAFKSSPDFALSSGKKPGTLVVTIPTNVGWRSIGKRTQVRYTVELSSAENRRIRTSTGSCWDDGLAKCAAQIVSDARTAMHKTH